MDAARFSKRLDKEATFLGIPKESNYCVRHVKVNTFIDVSCILMSSNF